MNFQQYDLGQRSRGEIIEVTLQSAAANVRLMDGTNFRHYKAGKSHKYQGGLVTKSPHRLVVPRSGHWYVTVDLNGLRSRSVRSTVRVLPGPLPKAKLAPTRSSALSSMPSLLHEPIGAAYADGKIVPAEKFDVFISHAFEDKERVARPLAHVLREKGLEVWYDEFTIRIGDKLRHKIDQGIANSQFGVIVLSEDFFKKGWTNHELDGLVTRSVSSDQDILPIWHGLSKKEVMAYSPSLGNTFALITSDYNIEYNAEEIAAVIHGAGPKQSRLVGGFDDDDNVI